jgi:hypothetical protein
MNLDRRGDDDRGYLIRVRIFSGDQ